jgi:hypothetical protein
MKLLVFIVIITAFSCKENDKTNPYKENKYLLELKKLPETSLTTIKIDSLIKFVDTIEVGQSLRGFFTISNIGNVPLEITGIQPGCSCITIGDLPIILNNKIVPGDSIKIFFSVPKLMKTGYFSNGFTVLGNFHAFYRKLTIEGYVRK